MFGMSHERIVLAVMGIDQHENGAIAIGRVLREAQMRVDYLGKFNTPTTVAEKAIALNANVVGISCHSWEYIRLAPQLVQELRRRGSNIPVVLGGSVITPEDGERVRKAGVSAVFTSSVDTLQVIECLRALSKSNNCSSRNSDT
jgi:methylmalonyl-CoA mutase C-terminal domain/subunit